jgi:hypothetical protein
MTFLTNPLGFTPAEFKIYVAKLQWRGWKPKFIVLHNTAEPNLAQWQHDNTGQPYEHRRIVNLNHYYKDEEGWHSGPHLFISPNLIWEACDLTADGVHASCYNSESLGVEMVGDYATEAFDSGDGAKVRDLTVAALAILHDALGIDPDTLHFHKECLKDHHDCPGKNVDKADMIARIKAAMKGAPAAVAAPIVGGGGSSGGAGASGSFAPTPAAKPAPVIPAPVTPALLEHVAAVTAASAPASYNERAATIYQFWLANGFTPAQACGLLAQADAESSLKPDAVGDHGQAFGMQQWHRERVDAIRNGCGVDLTKLPPLADQLKAALWELQHTEKHALNQIKATKTAFDAGYAAARFWERPAAVAQYSKRGNTAEAWGVYFTKHPTA